jgi:hypothetical protein
MYSLTALSTLASLFSNMHDACTGRYARLSPLAPQTHGTAHYDEDSRILFEYVSHVPPTVLECSLLSVIRVGVGVDAQNGFSNQHGPLVVYAAIRSDTGLIAVL